MFFLGLFYVLPAVWLINKLLLKITGHRDLAFGGTAMVVVGFVTFWLFFAGGLLLRCTYGGSTAYFHSINLDSGIMDGLLNNIDAPDSGFWPVFLVPIFALIQFSWWAIKTFFVNNCLSLDLTMICWYYFMCQVNTILGALCRPVNPNLLGMDKAAMKAWGFNKK